MHAGNADLKILDEYRIEYEHKKWSASSIFGYFDKSFASLITTGNDIRCTTKSNNRATMSIVNGCPVITQGDVPNMTELDDVIYKNLRKGIEKYYMSNRSIANREENIKSAQQVVERYKLREVVNIYETLVDLAKTKRCRMVKDKEVRNSHIEIAIVGDYMKIENIELTLKKFRKYSHLCKIIVCHVHTRPDQKLINLYSRYNIIPYLFQEFKLKESKVLINCKYIITTNEYAMQGNQFINGINEIEKTLRKDDPFIRINPKDLKNFTVALRAINNKDIRRNKYFTRKYTWTEQTKVFKREQVRSTVCYEYPHQELDT